MKKPVLLTCILLFILLAGCAVDQTQAPAATLTLAPPSPAPSKTNFWRIVTSTITLPPTNTLPPTLTPTSTATPFPSPSHLILGSTNNALKFYLSYLTILKPTGLLFS